MPLLDLVGNGLGHAAGLGKAAACSGSVDQILLGGVHFQRSQIQVLGLNDAGQLLKGQHEVHVGTHGAAGGLQLLGCAGADEHDAHVRMVLLIQPGGEHHGGHGHGDIVLELGEQLLGHHAPGGAAGGGHEGLLGGDLLQEVLGLLGGTHIGAHRHLDHLVEAHLTHGLPHLGGGDVLAELADKGRGHSGHHLIAPLDGLDQLEDLALVRDRAEGAVHQAHTAGDALIIIDLSPAQLVGADGVHAAGLCAGALDAQDGAIGALVGALAALDALILVDDALALDQGNGVLGAHLHTGVGQAALAHIGHPDLLGGAGVTGVGDDIDQRGLVVFLRDHAVLQLCIRGRILTQVPQGQADGQTDALGHYGALHQNVLAVLGHLARDDFVGQTADGLGIVAALKGHSGHLCKHLPPNVVDECVDTPHSYVSSFIFARNLSYLNVLILS